MHQQNLIDRLTEFLKRMTEIGGAFLGGSHGRDEADAFSDVDVYAVVTDSENIPDTFKNLANAITGVAPILYSQALANARTINCITDDWLRFDITVVTGFELGFLARGQVKPLFDRLGITDAVMSATQPPYQRSPDDLVADVNEFIRILGLSVVVRHRDDLVVAQTGTNLMRDILIRTMLSENGPHPVRGVLALSRSLTPAQQTELTQLPAAEANWPAIENRTKAIATAFFPRARRLATRLKAKWPDKFEQATKKYLSQEIGFEVEDSIRS